MWNRLLERYYRWPMLFGPVVGALWLSIPATCSLTVSLLISTLYDYGLRLDFAEAMTVMIPWFVAHPWTTLLPDFDVGTTSGLILNGVEVVFGVAINGAIIGTVAGVLRYDRAKFQLRAALKAASF